MAFSQCLQRRKARNVTSLATFLDTACTRFNGPIEQGCPDVSIIASASSM